MNNHDGSDGLGASTLIRFAKGCSAGFASSLMLQPLNVVKTSMQITPVSKKIEAIVLQTPPSANENNVKLDKA
jgi:hypothetical protein